MTSIEAVAVSLLSRWYAVRARLLDDRGEGVISMAIAVLVVAFVGAAAFVVFRNLLDSAGSKATTQVNNLGNG